MSGGSIMKFIGTRVDRDCYDAENVLKQSGIKFEYVDISASSENLKFFLDLRDHREEFVELKKQGYVGLPCFLLENGNILFDENEILKEELLASEEAVSA